jgi:hypothetical protein
MPATSKFYPRAMLTAFRKEWSWQSDSIYAAILKHNYDYSDLNTYWGDITQHEISNSLVNYTPGGKLLTSRASSGVAANSWGNIWAANTYYAAGSIVRPTAGNGHIYLAQNAGTSSSTQPTWPTTHGQSVTDASIVWDNSGSYAVTLSCDDPQWDNITFSSAGYLAIYSRSPATDATRPLIALVDLGGSQSITAGTFRVDASPTGIAVALTY